MQTFFYKDTKKLAFYNQKYQIIYNQFIITQLFITVKVENQQTIVRKKDPENQSLFYVF